MKTLTPQDPMPWASIVLPEKKSAKAIHEHVRSELAQALCRDYGKVTVPCPLGNDHPLELVPQCKRESFDVHCVFGHSHAGVIEAVIQKLRA